MSQRRILIGKSISVIDLRDKYVSPRVNESFQRYSFLKRVQEEVESFEHFLTDCRHLIKSCNYNGVDPNETVDEKTL